MSMMHTKGHVSYQLCSFHRREVPIRPHFLEQVRQTPALHQLHDQKGLTIKLSKRVDWDNRRMIQPGGGLSLESEPGEILF